MRNVLVTGATGFIGKALVCGLLDKGVRVTAIVMPSEKDMAVKLDKNGLLDLVVGDLGDPGKLQVSLSSKSYDTLYHLAWAGADFKSKNDLDIQKKNLSFSLAAMDLAINTGCKTVIMPGSTSEYAYSDSPITGMEAPSPCDYYGATKVAVHTYCELIARQRGINFHWVVISSIYGPGRDDDNIITYTIRALLSGKRPVYSGLEQKWDFIYIDDLVSGLYLIGSKGVDSHPYVVGNGGSYPLIRYIKTIRDKINPSADLGVGELPYKNNRIDNSVVDISMVREDTGFIPSIPFGIGIDRTIAYYREKAQTQA